MQSLREGTMGDDSIADIKITMEPHKVEETLAEVVIRNLRKRGQSDHIQEIIHEIKLVAGHESSVRVSLSYTNVREILVKHGYYFAHELCSTCIGGSEFIINLPAKYQPEEREHDTDSDQDYQIPEESSHEELMKLHYSSAWAATELCTCCNINLRSGDDRGTRFLTGSDLLGSGTKNMMARVNDAKLASEASVIMEMSENVIIH